MCKFHFFNDSQLAVDMGSNGAGHELSISSGAHMRVHDKHIDV